MKQMVAFVLILVAILSCARAAGPLTDRLNVPFTSSNGLSSTYHIFAAGLNWGQNVGLLVYCDGLGAYGLKNPNSNYLLAGSTGLIAVAKKHNLLLVTPFAPLPNCDGSDNCWHDSANGAKKATWSSNLIDYVKSQYTIAGHRVSIGGYSSGAQWTTALFLPLFGRLHNVKLATAISFGSPPQVTANFTTAYKANTVVGFNTGTADSQAYPFAQNGYTWYTNNGFITTATWPAGVTHTRTGQFGGIVDGLVTQYLPTATSSSSSTSTTGPAATPSPSSPPTPSPTSPATPSPTSPATPTPTSPPTGSPTSSPTSAPTPFPTPSPTSSPSLPYATTVSATANGVSITVRNIPSGASITLVYVYRVSTGASSYLYSFTKPTATVTFKTLGTTGEPFTYKVFASSASSSPKAEGSFSTFSA